MRSVFALRSLPPASVPLITGANGIAMVEIRAVKSFPFVGRFYEGYPPANLTSLESARNRLTCDF
jgi:hypothetical protein